MQSSNVLGFDASLTSSGFAYNTIYGGLVTGTIKPPKLRGTRRLAWIRHEVYELLHTALPNKLTEPPALFVIEDYAMGAKGRTFDIGELGGIVKLEAWTYKVNILRVPPSSLKMFATGKGNADKNQVMLAVETIWGKDIAQNDEADAFVLLQMGLAYLNKSKVRSKVRRNALSKCTFSRS